MTRFDTTLKARPTTYKGVEMRSRLEARFAAGCDKLGVAWEYEPRAFASEKGQYLPDFQIRGGDDEPMFIEVKPVIETPGVFDALEALAIIWESLPQASVGLASPELKSRVLMGRAQNWGMADWCRGWSLEIGDFISPWITEPTSVDDYTRRGLEWTPTNVVDDAGYMAVSYADGDQGLDFDWSWQRDTARFGV